MAKVTGIDLGTIKSCVAIIEAGQPIQQTKRSIVPPQAKIDRPHFSFFQHSVF